MRSGIGLCEEAVRCVSIRYRISFSGHRGRWLLTLMRLSPDSSGRPREVFKTRPFHYSLSLEAGMGIVCRVQVFYLQHFITHLTPLGLPLVPPTPLPMPVPLLPSCEPPLVNPVKLPPAPYPLLALPLAPLPLPLPRAPRTAVPACLCLSSSSAFRRASSLLLSSSAALLSAACAFITNSFSTSATSWLAPCQFGFMMSRWLCSVCERIRVQELSSVDADVTVRETVCDQRLSKQSMIFLVESAHIHIPPRRF